MNRQFLILVTLMMGLSRFTSAQVNCRSIETTDPRGNVWITANEIVQPGQYCLTHDIKAPRVRNFGGDRRYTNSTMLAITASNAVFDLRDYAMNVEASGMAGVRLEHEWKKPEAIQITVRNGTIKSRTQSAISFGAPDGNLLSDFKAIYKSPETAKVVLEETLKALPESADAYPRTEHTIDRMKIEAAIDNSGVTCALCMSVGMKGASNIIRNSTIEVTDGHAAIYLFGPNQLIENNIILFKGKAAVESAAAIKLHQADGTIIRNNDIIIESAVEDAPKAAISLIDSRNVIAENNRIYGINTLMHAWDDKSTLIERDNEFRPMLRRPWTTGAPGVR